MCLFYTPRKALKPYFLVTMKVSLTTSVAGFPFELLKQNNTFLTKHISDLEIKAILVHKLT